MKLRAKDLPSDGTSHYVTINGVEFELRRTHGVIDERKFIYHARRLPEPRPACGWWSRYYWDLMLADLRLMAKPEDNS